MKKLLFLFQYFLFFALVPVFLAWSQNVPVRFAYQRVILFVSLGVFGVLLGQFWLSRLSPRNMAKMKPSSILRWHKVIGYSAGVIMLLHPVLIIARRFWALESDPIDNLRIVVLSSSLLPAIIAWILLALILLHALIRRSLPGKSWRILHGSLSSCFAGVATWHVVTVGRHSDPALSALFVLLATGAIVTVLQSYLPASPIKATRTEKGVAHESAQ